MKSIGQRVPQHRNRWWLRLGSALLVFLYDPGFAADIGGKPEKVDVTVTYVQPSGVFTPVYVAYEAGLFKKYGLNAKLQLVSPAVSAQAVISGEADFYTEGSDLINARLRGGAVKYFGATLQQFVFQMWAAKEIATVQQLRGKTYAATTPRAALDIATREGLKKNGLIPDKDVKIMYVQSIPAVLTSVTSGKTSGGTLSAPNNLKARDAGMNMIADIGKLNIPGLQMAYGATENYIKNNPNTIYAFLKAVAEAVVVSQRDVALTKKAIAKYTKTDDARMIDETYVQYSPYWPMNLAVLSNAIQAGLSYLDEKEFPQAKNADVREFFDNSFVDHLELSGFFKSVGFIMP
ncbi:MAG: ABC transporter substrate-binding protein [Alphaproteobacteria bacterium]